MRSNPTFTTIRDSGHIATGRNPLRPRQGAGLRTDATLVRGFSDLYEDRPKVPGCEQMQPNAATTNPRYSFLWLFFRSNQVS